MGEFCREEGENWVMFSYRDRRTGRVYWVRACRRPKPISVLDMMLGTPQDAGAMAMQFETSLEIADKDRYRRFRSPVDGQPITILEIVGMDLIGDNEGLIEATILRQLVNVTGPEVLDRAARLDYNALLTQYAQYSGGDTC